MTFFRPGRCAGEGSGSVERPRPASADGKVDGTGFRDMYPANDLYVVHFVGLSPVRGRDLLVTLRGDMNR